MSSCVACGTVPTNLREHNKYYHQEGLPRTDEEILTSFLSRHFSDRASAIDLLAHNAINTEFLNRLRQKEDN